MIPKVALILVLCHAVLTQDAPASYATSNAQDTSYGTPAEQYHAPAPAYKVPEMPYPMQFNNQDSMYGPPAAGYDAYAMSPMGHSADGFVPPFPPFPGVPPQIAYGIESLLQKPLFHNFPKGLLKVVFNIGLLVFVFSVILLIGGGFTVAVCSLTHLCTLSFHGHHFSRKNITETMRGFLTPDRITAATSFVTDAIEKYQKIQGKSYKEALGAMKEFAKLSPYWKYEKAEKLEKKMETATEKLETASTSTAESAN